MYEKKQINDLLAVQRLRDESSDDSRWPSDSHYSVFMTDVDLREYPNFKQYVWDDPSLCNNCFMRVKQVVPIGKDHYRHSIRPALSDTVHFRTEEGVVAYATIETGGENHIYRATTSCDHCGSVGCRSIPDDSSRRELLRRLDRIIEWLEIHQGLDPDEDRMRTVLHEVKADTERQGNDPEILGEAVEAGV